MAITAITAPARAKLDRIEVTNVSVGLQNRMTIQARVYGVGTDDEEPLTFVILQTYAQGIRYRADGEPEVYTLQVNGEAALAFSAWSGAAGGAVEKAAALESHLVARGLWPS